jgi:hypothetical protein
MQAQEFAYAKWSVAQRARRVTDAAMDQAFADGAILRTHVVRPTWHFVSPADIRWMLDLTGPRVHAMNAYYYRTLGLDDAVLARTDSLLGKSLQGGQQLTRTELTAMLHKAGITASGLQIAYIFMHAELEAVLCSGARRGRQHTYALLAERAPHARILAHEEALAELTGRYFASRGPATLKDYVVWSSLTATDGRKGLDMIKSRLEHEVIDGRTYWFAASRQGVRPAAPMIDLVQGYDEYVMAYKESRDVLRMPGASRGTRQGDPTFPHAILLDGHVIGHWKHRLDKNAAIIETVFDRALAGPERRALNVAVDRYGQFLGVPATVVYQWPVGFSQPSSAVGV